MSRLTIPPEEFRALAHRFSDLAADYLEQLPDLPAFPAGMNGRTVADLFDTTLTLDGGGAVPFELLDEVIKNTRPNSPRFFGYVFGSALPVSILGDYFSAALNQNVTAWRSSPAAVTMERTVVRWLAEAVGCNGFSGSLCGGGSSANLMGLCMAREAKLGANASGARGGVIYCSEEAHMSIPKAAMLLGLGESNVRRIPVDPAFRMDVAALRRAIEEDIRAGLKPIAVVASAGTVATGSIDPFPEIADICQQHSLWMHVDGAYGALAALAAPEKFRGLSRANSISLDPHKWLYQPAGCGCLLYRDPAAARRAFGHSEDYARVLSTDPIEGFAFFEESIELSRPFRAMKIWLALRYFGLRAFQQSIGEDLRLAQILADAIRNDEKLELLAPVELSAVCFRHQGDDAFNRAILKRVIQRGRVYISNATIHGEFALRACVVNHRTTENDVLEVVSEAKAAAAEL